MDKNSRKNRGVIRFAAVLGLILKLCGAAILNAGAIKDDLARHPGVRAAGMAGAFTAIADDYSAFFYNPAGLANIDKWSASLIFDSALGGKQYDFGLNFIYPFFSDMTAGLSYIHTSYSDSKFSNDFLYLSYALSLRDDRSVTFGANFKLLNTGSGELGVNGFGTSIDAGFMIRPDFLEKKMRFGLFAQDLDAVIEWNNGVKERVPVFYKMAASYRIEPDSVAGLDIGFLDYGHMRDPRLAWNIGAEKWFNDRVIGDFGLRAGWQWREGMEPNSKFGIGASYAREEFRVNYAYVPAINNLGDAHKVDVSYFFLARPFEKGEKEKLPVVKGAEVAAGDFDLVAARLKNMQFELSTRNFSPGVGSKTRQAEFLLSGGPSAVKDAKWQAEIKDAKGGVVRVIKGAEEFQPALSWDGTDNYGKTVADGDYTVYYFVEYSGKKAWERTRVVSVDTKPPVFSVSASPKVFAPSSRTAGRVEIRVTTQDKDIKSWTAQVKTAKGSVIRRFSGEGINERIIWQADDALGNKVKDGEYETVVTLEDFAGNFSEFSDKVKADSYESRLGVSPKTAAFNPESGGAVFISNSRDSARIKSWDLEIYDSAGKPVRLYSNLSPELKSVSWDGNDAAGKRVSAGRIFTYRAKVEQKNGLVTEESGYLQSLPPVFEGVGIELTLAAIDFAKGSSEIPASEYGYLNQAAEAVKKYAKNYYVIIRGYGADAAGPAEALELSIKRVKEVKKYLSESQGVPEEHIYMTGYGDGSYFERKDAESAQKNPVRVEVELLTK